MKGASRFNLEDTYQEFIRLRGFDIRSLTMKEVERKDHRPRDLRDPEQLGKALQNRPQGTTVLEIANGLDHWAFEGGKQNHLM